jgi:hypothetical protein
LFSSEPPSHKAKEGGSEESKRVFLGELESCSSDLPQKRLCLFQHELYCVVCEIGGIAIFFQDAFYEYRKQFHTLTIRRMMPVTLLAFFAVLGFRSHWQ